MSPARRMLSTILSKSSKKVICTSIMRPKILAILPGLIPSTIINVTTPLIELHKASLINARVTVEMLVTNRDVEWSDLIILCRNVEPGGMRWFSKIIEIKKPYIYDIDDNFFELPIDTPAGVYHSSPKRLAMLEEYIRHARLVRVYSEPMLERAKSLNSSTMKVNGYVDWSLVTIAPQVQMEKQPVKIVYPTSRVNDNLAEIFKPALKKVLETYGNRVQVFFLGYNPAEFKSYPNVFFKPLTLHYEKYMRYFSSAGFDIGLAPLLDDIFHRSKTNLKVREYGACHIAGIYSDVDTYSTSVEHKKNGLLVKNTTEEWYNAMSLLIENDDLRVQIQKQAYQFALDHFSQETFNQMWYSQITDIMNRDLDGKDVEHRAQHHGLDLERINSFKRDISVANDSNPKMLNSGVKAGFTFFWSRFADRVHDHWLGRKLIRLASELKTNGISFLFLYIKMRIQMYWILLKIKLTLFFSKTQ